MIFYAYLWLRYDGTPYYVGKGCRGRAFEIDYHFVPPPKNRAFILIQEFECEKDALFAERFLISFYGRKDQSTGCLRNLTDGGEGERNESIETKMRRTLALIGNTRMLGKKHSEETKRKIGLGNSKPKRSAPPRSKEFYADCGLQRRGFRHSEESKMKMRLGKLGKKMSSAFVEKCKNRVPWNKGIPFDIWIKGKTA